VHLSKALQSAYDEQYTDTMTEWREVCGKYKAANILKVCRNHRFAKALECGAGEGSILKFLDESGTFSQLAALEISDSGVARILQRKLPRLKDVRKFDGYTIPYPDKTFDMAFCSHVLEHVEHPRILLRELKRVSNFQVFEVPLDYSASVDRKTGHFLSYGHINIYTPSLFRFLLKSEGYEIVSELLTHTSREAIRYNWYRNMALRKTWWRELALGLFPLAVFTRRMLWGRKRFEEFGYSAFTCLAQGISELKIF